MSRMGFTRQLPRRSTVIGRMRRNTELGLILLAVIVTGCAYVLASLAGSASLPANIGPFLVVILGLILAAHVANRRLAPNADGMLLPVAALLNGLGYVFIARLDDDLAGLQATWTALGIVGYIATLLVVRRTRTLERYRYTFMAIGIALLIIPLVPGIGREINGARIWASLGPVNFQPGEFAKIALAVFFAGYLVEKRELAQVEWSPCPGRIPRLSSARRRALMDCSCTGPAKPIHRFTILPSRSTSTVYGSPG
jgi:peptidoglycan glycosyltransferase